MSGAQAANCDLQKVVVTHASHAGLLAIHVGPVPVDPVALVEVAPVVEVTPVDPPLPLLLLHAPASATEARQATAAKRVRFVMFVSPSGFEKSRLRAGGVATRESVIATPQDTLDLVM